MRNPDLESYADDWNGLRDVHYWFIALTVGLFLLCAVIADQNRDRQANRDMRQGSQQIADFRH